MIGKTKTRLFLATLESPGAPSPASVTVAAHDFADAIDLLIKRSFLPKLGEYKILRIEDRGFDAAKEATMVQPFVWKEDWDNPGDWLLEPEGTGFAAAVHQRAHDCLWIVRKPAPVVRNVAASAEEARDAAGRQLLDDLKSAIAPRDPSAWFQGSENNPDHTFHRVDFSIIAGDVRAEVDFQAATQNGTPLPGTVVVVRGRSRYGSRHANALSEVPLDQLRAKAVELANEEVTRLRGLVLRLEATVGSGGIV